jgi:hypothetical protein
LVPQRVVFHTNFPPEGLQAPCGIALSLMQPGSGTTTGLFAATAGPDDQDRSRQKARHAP